RARGGTWSGRAARTGPRRTPGSLARSMDGPRVRPPRSPCWKRNDRAARLAYGMRQTSSSVGPAVFERSEASAADLLPESLQHEGLDRVLLASYAEGAEWLDDRLVPDRLTGSGVDHGLSGSRRLLDPP